MSLGLGAKAKLYQSVCAIGPDARFIQSGLSESLNESGIAAWAIGSIFYTGFAHRPGPTAAAP